MQSFTVVVAEGINAVTNAKTANIPHGMTAGQLGGKQQIFVETQSTNTSNTLTEKGR